ncbi:MAG: hypothetical protein JXB60_03620 [Candidatus Cloacimonetes bacterium]|nr:hypothetical protein [Candidatus Cloacimonadota bacterium]
MKCPRCGGKPVGWLTYFNSIPLAQLECKECGWKLHSSLVHRLILYISLFLMLAGLIITWVSYHQEDLPLAHAQAVSIGSLLLLIIINKIIAPQFRYYPVMNPTVEILTEKDRCYLSIVSGIVIIMIGFVYVLLEPVNYYLASIFWSLGVGFIVYSLKFLNWLKINRKILEIIVFIMILNFFASIIVYFLSIKESPPEDIPFVQQYEFLKTIGK